MSTRPITELIGVSIAAHGHPHPISEISGLQVELDGKQTIGAYLTAIDSPLVTTALGYTPVPPTRSVSTTAPLAGGGDLSANRTLAISAATTGAAGSLSAADKTKLDGIATAATANATDAQLRDRTTHSGAQAQSTVTNLVSDLAAKAPLAAPPFTGAVTTTGSYGFATGAGGTVTQLTNKATGVTLSKAHGLVTMNAAALAAATIVSHTLTNTAIAATDQVVCTHVSGGTSGAYTINAFPGAGSAVVAVRNNTAGSLSEAIVYRFTVVKGVNA